VPLGDLSFSIIKVLPYILVLVLALIGVNVFVALMTGIVAALVVGLIGGDISLMTGAQAVYSGFTGMFEIFLLSMLTGGLSQMVAVNGGIEWALNKIQSMIKSRRGAEVGIAALVSLTDVATANNTVGIIIAGPVAKRISTKYRVDPRRSASLLDSWSCVWQGIIPYGAQVLIACSLTAGAVTPFDLFGSLWYPYLLGVFALLSIFVPFADGLIKKTPWDWAKEDALSAERTDAS
jgi:Na+/H+ antiporter NhaC